MKKVSEITSTTGNSGTLSKVAGAVALGTMTGAILGLLFAPDKGKETRSRMANGAKGMANGLSKKVTEKASELTGRFRKVKQVPDRLDNMTSDFKKKLSLLKA